MFTLRTNPGFGPGWEILKDGTPITAAHEKSDAEDFMTGRIDLEGLRQRNEAIERRYPCSRARG